MIEVECWTNLDAAKQHIWPKLMAARPLLGDRVIAVVAKPDCCCSHLKVVGVSHAINSDGTPYMRVELNK